MSSEVAEMNPSYDFAGQVALVTGAGSGMGLVTARAFAEAGAAVVLADIGGVAAHAATDHLTAAGHQAGGVTCHVAGEEQRAPLVEHPGAPFSQPASSRNQPGLH